MNPLWQVSVAGWWSAGVGVAVLSACASATPASHPEPAAVVAPAEPMAAPDGPPRGTPIDLSEPGSSEQVAAEPERPEAVVTPPLPGSVRARKPRSAAVIATEVAALERLLTATQSTAPDRPVILKPLGDEYAELAAAFGLDGRAADEQSAHRKAVERYTTLKNHFPSFNGLDDALYSLGSEYLALGERDGARRPGSSSSRSFPGPSCYRMRSRDSAIGFRGGSVGPEQAGAREAILPGSE